MEYKIFSDKQSAAVIKNSYLDFLINDTFIFLKICGTHFKGYIKCFLIKTVNKNLESKNNKN